MGTPRPFRTIAEIRRSVEHIRGCQWCRTRASLTPALPSDLRKQIGLPGATNRKEQRIKMSKEGKRLRKALSVDLARSVDLNDQHRLAPGGRGGYASTAVERMSDDAYREMVTNSATAQTSTVQRAVLKAFDDRVTKARAALAAAANEFEKARAKADLTSALKSRLSLKLMLKEQARVQGRAKPSRFGPNSVDLFGGSSLTLPDDPAVKGWSGGGR